MYGMFFFMSQFFQDVQGYSPLRAGIAFLPIPVSVFASSQLTSRILADRLPAKVLMIAGAAFVTVSLLLAAQVHEGTSYGQIVVALVLLGVGSGISFVSLTSASLANVDPGDAGAASGLINVTQQVGAALGLAVLVTAFGVVTHHTQLGADLGPSARDHAHAVIVHGLDAVFRIGLIFSVSALVLVAALVRSGPDRTAELEPAEANDEDGWSADAVIAEAG